MAGWAQWAARVFPHGMPDCAHISISNSLNKISKNLLFLETNNGFTFRECSDGPAKVRSRCCPRAGHNGDYRFRLRNFGKVRFSMWQQLWPFKQAASHRLVITFCAQNSCPRSPLRNGSACCKPTCPDVARCRPGRH